jgi:sigma-E factor negative regulatory protein RseC
MIEERAIVTGLDGDLAIIQMQRQSTCDHCELSSGCGTGAIGRLLGHRVKPLTISNKYNLKPGDSILLGMPDTAFLSASLLIYGLPLVGLIGGGIMADWIYSRSELYVFIFAIIGFIAGLVISDQIATKRFSRQFNPRILEVSGEPLNRIRVL